MTERSTEEETPIARAVSGSLCVCVRNLRSLLIMVFVFRGATVRFVKDGEYRKGEVYWGATISLHRFVKDGEYRKEIRGILLNHTGQKAGVLTERSTFLPQFRPLGKSRVVFLGTRPLFTDREIYRGRDAWAVSGSFVFFECL